MFGRVWARSVDVRRPDRIAAVLDTLHVRDVVGHSIGGAEALRLAYRRPDLVKGVVTIEGGPTEATMTPPSAFEASPSPLKARRRYAS